MTFSFPDIVFTLIIVLLFYVLHPACRLYILAAASMYYAYILDPATATSLLVVTILIYISSLFMERLKTTDKNSSSSIRPDRIVMIITVAVCILSLIMLKYLPNISGYLREDSILQSVILPLGYSYYIFQAISYIVDVYENKTTAESNPVRLLLYLAWFSKLSSGPIERYNNLRIQIKNIKNVRLHDPDRWTTAFAFIIFGCFYKLMIADRIAYVVDQTFSSPTEYGSLWLILGVLGYTLQIYSDFAGYSMLAIGVSLLFGIRLSANFSSPYCSENISEFWRRWHMSLSFFLRDYLYIPLGGNRRGEFRKVINTMIVFLVCGLWHGIGFGFVFWGLLHGFYSAFDGLAKKRNWTFIRTGISGRIITFLSVSFAWIFFRAVSLTWGLVYIRTIFRNITSKNTFMSDYELLDIPKGEMPILLISLAIMILIDIYTYSKNTDIAAVVSKWPIVCRYLLLCTFLVLIAVYGIYGPDTSGALIYSQF